MPPRNANVLISSAGRRVELLRIFRKSLGELGLDGEVLAIDQSKASAAFHSADRAFVVPRCTSPEFVPEVHEICRSNEVSLVVPTIDTELPMYASARSTFSSQGTTVAVSTPEVVAIAGDKVRTHDWLVAQGFPTVKQSSVAEVLASPADWTLPVLAKPRFGSASIGVQRIEKREQLECLADPERFIVQRLAPGTEHTIDAYVDSSGRCRCTVPRRRIEVRAGEVSKGVTVRESALMTLVHDICTKLPGAFGVLNVQVFHDPGTHQMNVIEINPRFGGGFPLAWQAGALFPKWLLEEVHHLPSSISADAWRDGLVMLRYDAAVFVDAMAAGVD